MTAARHSIARIGLVAALIAPAIPAIAQNPPSPAGPAAKAPDRTPPPARRRGQPRVIEIEAVTVEGEVQKPEAFYILQRSDLNFKGLEPARSFIPLVIESVEKDPF